MGLLRPARRVTSPSGDDWEVYVSKTVLPSWRGGNADDVGSGPGPSLFPVNFVLFLWSNLVLPIARMLVLLPLAFVRGRRSRAVRIEALNTFPHRQVLLWTTTDIHATRVLDEIAAGLANGTIAQPEGAFYSGPEQS